MVALNFIRVVAISHFEMFVLPGLGVLIAPLMFGGFKVLELNIETRLLVLYGCSIPHNALTYDNFSFPVLKSGFGVCFRWLSF